jgi:predicted ATPase/DNA-binding CsgD family transcriptional regulator
VLGFYARFMDGGARGPASVGSEPLVDRPRDFERAHALPTQLSSFIGRARELQEVVTLLGHARLVTLTGPAGSGKTRLGLELTRRVSNRFPGGVFFVDLAPIRDPELVPATIAAVLGIRAHPRRRFLDLLIEGIGEQRLLLMLDNLEQLPGAAPIVRTLLSECSNLRVLTTSRAPLHLAGEQEYPVEPLDQYDPADIRPAMLEPSDAMALFVDRAKAIDPHFALTLENVVAVAEICRHLDGLPLAIELAAARTRLLGPEALLDRLEQRLPLLTGGAVDAPARQRSLRDAIAWSYELLEPDDKTVFARLSVFVSDSAIVDAEFVVPDPADPPGIDLLEALGRLADQNLVRIASHGARKPRFSFLETILEFASERLAANDAEAEGVRRRHASLFAELAESATAKLGGSEHADALDTLSSNLGNLRAALEWSQRRGVVDVLVRLAVVLAIFLREYGDHREAGRWLRAAQAVGDQASPALRAKLLLQLANFDVWHGGDRTRATKLFGQSLDIHESLGDQAGAGYTLFQMAAMAADTGDRTTGLEHLERALSIARRLDDRAEGAKLFAWFAVSYSLLDPVDARTVAEEALARGRDVGDHWVIALASMALGWAELAIGDPSGARWAMSEGLRTYREIESRMGTGWALVSLGTALLRTGDKEAARASILEGCVHVQAAQSWAALCGLECAADWLGAAGRPEPASVLWAAVDANRAVTKDRTYANDVGMFTVSRERDRAAVRPGAFERARARGAALTLDEAFALAIAELGSAAPGRSQGPEARDRGHGHDLTPREREVLALVAAGRSDGEIAKALFISKKTASVHVANIKGKLGAESRIEIAIIARRLGLAEQTE